MEKISKLINPACLLLAIITGLAFSSCGSKKGVIKDGVVFQDETTSLKPLFLKVKNEYDLASARMSPKIHITEVDAVFDVANTYILEGSVSVWVAKADYKRTTAGESTITYSLIDTIKENSPKPLMHDSIPDSNRLARLILKTTEKFLEVQNLNIASLKPQTFEIDINYSVDKEGNIDISPTIGKIGLDGSYDIDHKVAQTITLKFELKPLPKQKS